MILTESTGLHEAGDAQVRFLHIFGVQYRAHLFIGGSSRRVVESFLLRESQLRPREESAPRRREVFVDDISPILDVLNLLYVRLKDRSQIEQLRYLTDVFFR